MPSPGAVWPAMVRNGFVTVMFDFNAIVPLTRKTTMRGPSVSHASRRLPGPESLRFVTKRTRPPRPPGVLVPKPSAPGNAGKSDAAGGASAAISEEQAASAASDRITEGRRFIVRKIDEWCDWRFHPKGNAAHDKTHLPGWSRLKPPQTRRVSPENLVAILCGEKGDLLPQEVNLLVE